MTYRRLLADGNLAGLTDGSPFASTCATPLLAHCIAATHYAAFVCISEADPLSGPAVRFRQITGDTLPDR